MAKEPPQLYANADLTGESNSKMLRRQERELNDFQTWFSKNKNSLNLSKKELLEQHDAWQKSIEERHQKERMAKNDNSGVKEQLNSNKASIEILSEEEELRKMREEMARINRGRGFDELDEAAKRRIAKRQKVSEEMKKWEAEQRALGPSKRDIEIDTIKNMLGKHNMYLVDTPTDGGCMYHAVNYGLTGDKTSFSDENVRKLKCRLADWLEEHKDEYKELIEAVTGSWEHYLFILRDRFEWGGELELSFLSSMLKKCITVWQAEDRTLKYGEDFEKDSAAVNVCYLKYYTGNKHGGHYSSIGKLDAGL